MLEGEAFERANDELRQMEEGKKQAIAAALGEYNRSKSKDLGELCYLTHIYEQDILDFFKASRRSLAFSQLPISLLRIRIC